MLTDIFCLYIYLVHCVLDLIGAFLYMYISDILYCMDVNFCSGHGDCVSMPGYDLCDCEPGWKGPHCAESKLLISPV